MRLAGPCDNLTGPAKALCEGGDDKGGGSGGGGGGSAEPPSSLDPLQQLAHEMAKAASWSARQLGKVVTDRDTVDLTNGGFLRQYAIVFAAATVLVLLLWLMAVAKRAVRGVPFTEAFTEAIGLLWLAVGATAFTPLILYTVIGAASAVTDALATGFGTEPGGLFNSLGKALESSKGTGDGGPVILIVTSLATIVLCGALWLLLVLRALGLYVGAVLGVVVYAGLVDKDLWGHVRRWAGVMISLILIEPIVVIVLGLANVFEAEGDVVTGLAVTLVALGAAIYIMSKAPGAGDAIKVARATGRAAGGATRAVVGSGGAAAGVQHGIQTHAGRPAAAAASATGGGGNSGGGGISGGMTAHSQRPANRPTGGGTKGSAPSPPPQPRKTDDNK
ncbi:hypothetical protein [Streptomyces axinellae]|uniref:Integral membrane protein n=1 Tax=Streptomyces axinellae TaxID=552788 RepID=A0ABP6DF44_9ACTN